MSRHCDSCGGVIGQDCFNPEECAYISQQQAYQQQQKQENDIDTLYRIISGLEERIKQLEEHNEIKGGGKSE